MQLPNHERRRACEIGRARYEENRKLNRPGRYGGPGNDPQGLRLDLLGACEAALAWWRGEAWDGNLGNLDAADVGKLQARTTAHPCGRLILHPPPILRPDGKWSRGDKPTDAFVHIKAKGGGRFELVGWLWGAEGQSRLFWWDPGNDRPAYFVPDVLLLPMSEALYRSF